MGWPIPSAMAICTVHAYYYNGVSDRQLIGLIRSGAGRSQVCCLT